MASIPHNCFLTVTSRGRQAVQNLEIWVNGATEWRMACGLRACKRCEAGSLAGTAGHARATDRGNPSSQERGMRMLTVTDTAAFTQSPGDGDHAPLVHGVHRDHYPTRFDTWDRWQGVWGLSDAEAASPPRQT